jgi:hypothetical protein
VVTWVASVLVSLSVPGVLRRRLFDDSHWLSTIPVVLDLIATAVAVIRKRPIIAVSIVVSVPILFLGLTILVEGFLCGPVCF